MKIYESPGIIEVSQEDHLPDEKYSANTEISTNKMVIVALRASIRLTITESFYLEIWRIACCPLQ